MINSCLSSIIIFCFSILLYFSVNLFILLVRTSQVVSLSFLLHAISSSCNSILSVNPYWKSSEKCFISISMTNIPSGWIISLFFSLPITFSVFFLVIVRSWSSYEQHLIFSPVTFPLIAYFRSFIFSIMLANVDGRPICLVSNSFINRASL